jgi:hypothetical protein
VVQRRGSAGPGNVATGSFATDAAGLACRLMSVPVRERPTPALPRNDALGRERTHAPQQRGSLFDHFVGGREKRWRDGKAECPSGLKVDGQFELRR